MTVAALIDLGLDPARLEAGLRSLGPLGARLKVWKDSRKGVSGTRFDVEVESNPPRRSYEDIRGLIGNSGLASGAKTRALSIFDLLAEAEARVHGVNKSDVHFHEIGAVDSIVDVVCVAVGFDELSVTRTACSPLPLGRGFVATSHGRLPIPAPATLELLKGVPVIPSDEDVELVTPTGAAIVRALARKFGDWPEFSPMRIGYGLGKSDRAETPNVLRIILGETEPHWTEDSVTVLETALDDVDPRLLGNLMDDLFAAGARDVFFSAVQMKKNRPATLVKVLLDPEKTGEIAAMLFQSTSTLGARVSKSRRLVLPRRSFSLETSFGAVRVKEVTMPDGRKELRPEFDDVREIARTRGVSAREILQALERELAGYAGKE
jgi:uncharacterized protein (TIGR00299 family) protein